MDSLCFEVSSGDGVSFVWKDYALNPSLLEDDLRQVFQSDPFIQDSRYSTVQMGLFLGPSALTPARFFNPERSSDYWHALSPLNNGEIIYSDALPAYNAYMGWPISDSLCQLLRIYHPEARLFHGASAWLEGLYRFVLSTHTGYAIFAHSIGQYMVLAAFDNRSLRFFNMFIRQTARDFLYYVLLALDQAQFQQDQTSLYLTGKLTADAEISLLLQRYFTSMHFLAPDDAGPYPATLPAQNRHWFFDLGCIRQF